MAVGLVYNTRDEPISIKDSSRFTSSLLFIGHIDRGKLGENYLQVCSPKLRKRSVWCVVALDRSSFVSF